MVRPFIVRTLLSTLLRYGKVLTPHFLTGNCALSSYDIWPGPGRRLPVYSSLRYHLFSGCYKWQQKFPYVQTCGFLVPFCAVQSYVATENWYFFRLFTELFAKRVQRSFWIMCWKCYLNSIVKYRVRDAWSCANCCQPGTNRRCCGECLLSKTSVLSICCVPDQV